MSLCTATRLRSEHSEPIKEEGKDQERYTLVPPHVSKRGLPCQIISILPYKHAVYQTCKEQQTTTTNKHTWNCHRWVFSIYHIKNIS